MPSTKPRRRLGDLYVRGKKIEIDDGSGDPVCVWLQKLNEIDREAILRRASAGKARYLIEAEKEDNELFLATLANVRDFVDRDGTIAITIAEEVSRVRQRLEAQMTHDENGWGKDEKIQRLIDAWTGSDDTPGLAAAFAEDENDPEALKVKAEIETYEADLDAAVESETERLKLDWESFSDLELARAASREVLKRRANDEFMKEWGRQQIFYCVRDPDDHYKRYFATMAEVDDLHEQVREQLDRHCNTLFVDLAEGKDSPPTSASSTSSAPTAAGAQSVRSGPGTATP